MARHNSKQLDAFFRNPPQGGNARGVQTEHQMAPRPANRLPTFDTPPPPVSRAQAAGPPCPNPAAELCYRGGLTRDLNAGIQMAFEHSDSSDEVGLGEYRNLDPDRSPSAPVNPARVQPRTSPEYPRMQQQPPQQDVRSDGKRVRAYVDPDPTA